MKRFAMLILTATALGAASPAFARPYGYYRGYYGGYGYCYGGPRIVNGVVSLVGASLGLAADIATLPLRGGVYCPAPATVCPTVYSSPVVTYRPAPAVYSSPVVTYRPAPVVYSPPVYVVR